MGSKDILPKMDFEGLVKEVRKRREEYKKKNRRWKWGKREW